MILNIFMPKFFCVWSKTGDQLELDPCDVDFAVWYFTQCQNQQSEFFISEDIVDMSGTASMPKINLLKQHILTINEFLNKIKFPRTISLPNDFYDQNALNQLHKDWISILRDQPKIDTLMYKIDPLLFDNFHDINQLVHSIENNIVFRLTSQPRWRVDNPWPATQLDGTVHNLQIIYTDFGKTSFEKWRVNDLDPCDEELSEWKTLGGYLKCTLGPILKMEIPSGYLEYCSRYGLTPMNERWPLADFTNINETLPLVRKLFDLNLFIPDNPMKLEMI